MYLRNKYRNCQVSVDWLKLTLFSLLTVHSYVYMTSTTTSDVYRTLTKYPDVYSSSTVLSMLCLLVMFEQTDKLYLQFTHTHPCKDTGVCNSRDWNKPISFHQTISIQIWKYTFVCSRASYSCYNNLSNMYMCVMDGSSIKCLILQFGSVFYIIVASDG